MKLPKTIINIIALSLISAFITACATVPVNRLTEAEIRTFALTHVDVDIPASTRIRWGRFKREQERIAQGQPLDGSPAAKYADPRTQRPNNLFPTAQEHKRQMIAQPFERFLKESASEIMVGERPVKADVTVEDINVVSAAQSLLFGGATTIKATITLIDGNTNTVLTTFTSQHAQAGYAPGGVLGVVVGETGTLNKYESAVRRLSKSFRFWLIPNEDNNKGLCVASSACDS